MYDCNLKFQDGETKGLASLDYKVRTRPARVI